MQRIDTNDIYGEDPYLVYLESVPAPVFVPAGSPGLSDPPHMTGTASQDPIYPIANITDNHPQKLAKSLGVDIVRSIPMMGPSSSIALFNTNASIAKISILDGVTGDEILSIDGTVGEHTLELQGASTYEQLITDRDKANLREFFVTYDKVSLPHVINITLQGPVDSSFIYSGVVFAGLHRITSSITHGVTRTYKDFSIVAELNSGATYTLKRSIVRKFSFNIDTCTSGGTPEDLKETFIRIGPDPIPWLIHESPQETWLVFARKDSEPSDNFYAFNRTRSSISLIEVL